MSLYPFSLNKPSATDIRLDFAAGNWDVRTLESADIGVEFVVYTGRLTVLVCPSVGIRGRYYCGPQWRCDRELFGLFLLLFGAAVRCLEIGNCAEFRDQSVPGYRPNCSREHKRRDQLRDWTEASARSR